MKCLRSSTPNYFQPSPHEHLLFTHSFLLLITFPSFLISFYHSFNKSFRRTYIFFKKYPLDTSSPLWLATHSLFNQQILINPPLRWMLLTRASSRALLAETGRDLQHCHSLELSRHHSMDELCEGVMLYEISLSKKDKYCMIPHI